MSEREARLAIPAVFAVFALFALFALAALLALSAGGISPANDLDAPSTGGGESRTTESAAPAWHRAAPDRAFRFPHDHGAHRDFATEWWYYTGHLTSEGGARYGFQLTFFRVGLGAGPASGEPVSPPESAWRLDEIYLAHFAVSDLSRERHTMSERLNRRGPGTAGAAAESLAVFVEDWSAEEAAESAETAEPADEGAPGDATGMAGTSAATALTAQVTNAPEAARAPRVHRLRARGGGFGIDLRASPAKVPVVHGESGVSRKSRSGPGASHYISITRLATTGMLIAGEETLRVNGACWMDHEFGSDQLAADQTGWDWMGLHLDDGSDLMLYRMRGEGAPFLQGTLVPARGDAIPLAERDIEMTPVSTWTSPATGARYPIAWRVRVPAHGLALEVRARFAAQELTTAKSTGVSYWEGSVEARGTRGDEPIGGEGYLEMTGYAEAFDAGI